jgi:hypothetical protein
MTERGGVWAFGQNCILKKKKFVNGEFDAPAIKEAALLFFEQCMRPTPASKSNLSRCI